MAIMRGCKAPFVSADFSFFERLAAVAGAAAGVLQTVAIKTDNSSSYMALACGENPSQINGRGPQCFAEVKSFGPSRC